MEKILNVHQLTKKFRQLNAVDQLSFSIEKGHVYGLLGPNGSGKSTTLGMLLNVVNPTSGSFQWFENKCATQEALKKIGAIIESPNFYPSMTALDNLKLVAKIKEIQQPDYEATLRLVELWDRKDEAFKNFSLGMKQRLAIASALLNKPAILILDEPTNGLDPKGIRQIRDIILQIAQSGTTILLASHLLDEVEKICTHVIVLQKGKMIYNGKVDEMKASYGFIELASENQEQLVQLLQNLPEVKDINQTEYKFVKAILKSELKPAEINQLCFEKGIVLTHLQWKKDTLEDNFLALTKSENHA
ncbi:ABC transporter ATP-binding protein [Psychroflexus maritimus]|uniref:ABC transporter ATP-binding protein n=1 Tax=Psychroflexus maritimus TaxID=2714865 RepID=A0A967AE72_9FLAO|nr:ABC transporter ATP-binding protein [Psychroflexus maritimus]NGZ89638.1 ABC transporter ATP-binding protein [Psychroflexus maritimus]